jgi:hypothetical protein
MHTYKNPWHKTQDKHCGPEFYQCYSAPKEYKGYNIFHRLPQVYDIVKDNVCVSQYAGPNGARKAIDGWLVNAQ